VSYNNISKMEGLDALVRLMNVDLTGNRISAIPKLPRLRALHTLRLAGNRVASLEEISNLKHLPCLSVTTLEKNPVAVSENLRSYAIYAVPTLDCVDGASVTMEERREAGERYAREEVERLESLLEERDAQLAEANSMLEAGAHNMKKMSARVRELEESVRSQQAKITEANAQVQAQASIVRTPPSLSYRLPLQLPSAPYPHPSLIFSSIHEFYALVLLLIFSKPLRRSRAS
jgi:C4-dicarboxylate-specific signal transduction histidine kinase